MSRARYWVYAIHNARWSLTQPLPEQPDLWELSVTDEHGEVESTIRTSRRSLVTLAGYLGNQLARTEAAR